MRERPPQVLADHRVRLQLTRALEQLDIVSGADVAEHHGRVALEPCTSTPKLPQSVNRQIPASNGTVSGAHLRR